VTDNSAESGGGIEAIGAAVRSVKFENNDAVFGGGLALNDLARGSSLIDVIFVDNHAGSTGGAIFSFGPLSMKRGTFIKNRAGFFGGAISFGNSV
jgi:predicted outer membrane repeat protein